MMTGVLRKVIAGFCYVEAGQFIYECKPRGNIKRIIVLKRLYFCGG